MTIKDLIRSNINLSDAVVARYLDDLSDEEISLPHIPGMNPIAWQIGHLILSERSMAESLKPSSSPPPPEGFAEAYNSKGAKEGANYHTKSELISAWKAQRVASLAILEEIPESRFDEPSGVSYAPTIDGLLSMIGNHTMMHVGQWAAVRRLLNKKIAI